MVSKLPVTNHPIHRINGRVECRDFEMEFKWKENYAAELISYSLWKGTQSTVLSSKTVFTYGNFIYSSMALNLQFEVMDKLQFHRCFFFLFFISSFKGQLKFEIMTNLTYIVIHRTCDK